MRGESQRRGFKSDNGIRVAESPARSTISQTKCPMHKDSNTKNQNEIVRENPYNYEGRIKAVTRRIENSKAISKRNTKLVCDHAAVQGLSQASLIRRFTGIPAWISIGEGEPIHR